MKTEREVREYLVYQGVPYTEPIYDGKPKLRVMDVTQLPGAIRDQFDKRGFFLAPEQETSTTTKKSGGKK